MMMLMNLRVNYVCIKISRRSCDWYQYEFYFYPSWISSIQMKKIILIKVQFNWSNSVWYWRNEKNTLIQAQRSEQHFLYKKTSALSPSMPHIYLFRYFKLDKNEKKEGKKKNLMHKSVIKIMRVSIASQNAHTCERRKR